MPEGKIIGKRVDDYLVVCAWLVANDVLLEEASLLAAGGKSALIQSRKRHPERWARILALAQGCRELLERAKKKYPGAERHRELIREGLCLMDDEGGTEQQVNAALALRYGLQPKSKPFGTAKRYQPDFYAAELQRRGVPDLRQFPGKHGACPELHVFFRMRRAAKSHVADGLLLSHIDCLAFRGKPVVRGDIYRHDALWKYLCELARTAARLPNDIQKRMGFFRDGVRVIPQIKGDQLVFTADVRGRKVPAMVFHPGKMPPPDTYPYGPVRGTKQQLGSWLGSKGSGVVTGRTLESKIKSKVIWVRRLSRQVFEAFFRLERDLATANARRLRDQSQG